MELQKALNQIILQVGGESASGSVATYIPELAHVQADLLAIAVCDTKGNIFSAGDADHRFTLQSVSKAFSLALALKQSGEAVFNTVGYEPTGNPFFSMLPMESEYGKPRNPFVNSGALAVTGMLQGKSATAKYSAFLDFLSELCDGQRFFMDESTYYSESETGFRNRAMANFLRQYGWIQDVDASAEAYFMQCSTLTNVQELARAGLFLANRGMDPITGMQVISPQHCRTIVTLMTTCGTYDYAGHVAIDIGIPCKSGVSGAILAIVPGKYSIAAFSPRLGDHGNSVAGMSMLQSLSQSMELSLFQ